MIFLILYILGVFLSCMLCGYAQIDKVDQIFLVSFFWPILIPVFLLLLLGHICYYAGEYLLEKPNEECVKYIRNKLNDHKL